MPTAITFLKCVSTLKNCPLNVIWRFPALWVIFENFSDSKGMLSWDSRRSHHPSRWRCFILEPLAPRPSSCPTCYLLHPAACPSLPGPAWGILPIFVLMLKDKYPMLPFHYPSYDNLSQSFLPLACQLLESGGHSLSCRCSPAGLSA